VAVNTESWGANTIAYSSDGITWQGSTNGNSIFSQAYGVCSKNAPNLYPPVY
jgi:hypothetical protein